MRIRRLVRRNLLLLNSRQTTLAKKKRTPIPLDLVPGKRSHSRCKLYCAVLCARVSPHQPQPLPECCVEAGQITPLSFNDMQCCSVQVNRSRLDTFFSHFQLRSHRGVSALCPISLSPAYYATSKKKVSLTKERESARESHVGCRGFIQRQKNCPFNSFRVTREAKYRKSRWHRHVPRPTTSTHAQLQTPLRPPRTPDLMPSTQRKKEQALLLPHV